MLSSRSPRSSTAHKVKKTPPKDRRREDADFDRFFLGLHSCISPLNACFPVTHPPSSPSIFPAKSDRPMYAEHKDNYRKKSNCVADFFHIHSSSSSFLLVQGTLSKKNIVEPLKLDVFFIVVKIFDSPSYSSFRLLRRFPPVRLQQQNWGGKEGPPMLIGNKNLLTSNLRQKTGALFEVAANRGADDGPTEKETTTVIEGL